MLTQDRYSALTPLTSDEGIVSLYLGFEPRLLYDRGITLSKFRSASRWFEDRETNDRWREAFEREKNRIQRFLQEWKPRGRGLAIFACEPEDLWEVFHLDVFVPTMLQVDFTTKTGILATVLDEFPRFAFVAVQRDHAAIHVSEQRGHESEESIDSDVPGKHNQGGWAQSRMSRHIEFHANEHLKVVVEALERLDQEKPFDSLVLGGTAETTAALQKLLPEAMRSKLIGTVPIDVKHSTEAELLEQALEVRENAEREEEKRLVASILEGAGENGAGVVGVDDTLDALLKGRVRELAIVEDAGFQGAECKECSYVAAEAFDRCPLCGGAARRQTNILDRAVERAHLSGAKVNFVYGEARDRLRERGGVGALLRY